MSKLLYSQQIQGMTTAQLRGEIPFSFYGKYLSPAVTFGKTEIFIIGMSGSYFKATNGNRYSLSDIKLRARNAEPVEQKVTHLLKEDIDQYTAEDLIKLIPFTFNVIDINAGLQQIRKIEITRFSKQSVSGNGIRTQFHSKTGTNWSLWEIAATSLGTKSNSSAPTVVLPRIDVVQNEIKTLKKEAEQITLSLKAKEKRIKELEVELDKLSNQPEVTRYTPSMYGELAYAQQDGAIYWRSYKGRTEFKESDKCTLLGITLDKRRFNVVDKKGTLFRTTEIFIVTYPKKTKTK